ncbi:hypothetical protein HYPGJ_31333 [Hyphomicrobium sp. GJ21]|nr:hypothetical protein HYPGJ_31333 [Hyphomicrobium sp. GJ21]
MARKLCLQSLKYFGQWPDATLAQGLTGQLVIQVVVRDRWRRNGCRGQREEETNDKTALRSIHGTDIAKIT